MKNRLIRLALIIFSVVITLFLISVVAYRLVNRTNGTLVSSGERREYLLYVPESYDASIPTPLVISLHGLVQWPANQMELSHWNELADQHGFIAVFPSGTHFPLRWRTGGKFPTETDPEQDVVFISDLIDRLEAEYNIDPKRIYVNGMSNGGGMTFVLSCQLSQRIAAVGMVAGAYFYPWEYCGPNRQVPAVVFHGTDDPIVPYMGGQVSLFGSPFPAIPEWVAVLAHQNGCAEVPEEILSHGDVSGVAYTDCEADVVFYTVHGGGHAWPGGKALPSGLVAYTTQDVDATRTMWDFFLLHPLPEGRER